MEMSFISQQDILALIEKMLIEMIGKIMPEKKISFKPFPRITYQQAMEKYHSDKPDLRKNKNDPNELAFCFITDFPLFEYSETEKKLVAVHHPFTAPQKQDLNLLETDPLKVKAEQYDAVCNGFEIGGGSIRIYKKDLQEKIFKILNIEEREIKRRFGHILEAFEYGAPPHGGIALGFDRLIMILANEPNIREVIPFAKTTDAKDLMMGAPSELPQEQLEQVHIKIINNKKPN